MTTYNLKGALYGIPPAICWAIEKLFDESVSQSDLAHLHYLHQLEKNHPFFANFKWFTLFRPAVKHNVHHNDTKSIYSIDIEWQSTDPSVVPMVEELLSMLKEYAINLNFVVCGEVPKRDLKFVVKADRRPN